MPARPQLAQVQWGNLPGVREFVGLLKGGYPSKTVQARAPRPAPKPAKLSASGKALQGGSKVCVGGCLRVNLSIHTHTHTQM